MAEEFQVDAEGNQILDDNGSPIPVETGTGEGEDTPPEPTVEIDGEQVPLSEVKKLRDKEKDYDQRKTDLEKREGDLSNQKEDGLKSRGGVTGFKRKTDEELEELGQVDFPAYHKYMRQEKEADRQEQSMASGIRRVNDDINSLVGKHPEIGGVKNKNIVDRSNPIWKILESNPGLFQTNDPVGLAYAKLTVDGLPDHDKKIAEKTKKELEEHKKMIGSTTYIVGDKKRGNEKTITLTAEEKRVAERTGLTPEQYAANKGKAVIEE